MEISYTINKEYLYVRMYETYSLEEMKKYILDVNQKILETEKKKVFVDLRELEQVFEKEFDRVLIIGFLDKYLPKDVKISMLNTFAKINFRAVETGLKFGYKINVFTDETKALEWLLEK